MNFCPTCGVAVKNVLSSDGFLSPGETKIAKYVPLETDESQRALWRVHLILEDIQKAFNSNETQNQKLDIIQSHVQRIIRDLPRAEPPPPEKPKFVAKKKPDFLKPEQKDDEEEIDEGEFKEADLLVESLLKKAAL